MAAETAVTVLAQNGGVIITAGAISGAELGQDIVVSPRPRVERARLGEVPFTNTAPGLVGPQRMRNSFGNT